MAFQLTSWKPWLALTLAILSNPLCLAEEAKPLKQSVFQFTLLSSQANSSTVKKAHADALEHAINKQQWAEYVTALDEAITQQTTPLTASKREDKLDPLFKHPVFYQHFLRWKLIQTLTPESLSDPSEHAHAAEMTQWLFSNNTAMEEILITFSEHDDQDYLLDFLFKAHAKDQELFKKYFNLALAVGLTFDSGELSTPLVSPSAGDSDDYHVHSAIERYQWYVDSNEKGRTQAPTHRSSARDLCFVVHSPIVKKEFDWITRHYRGLNRKRLGRTYTEVEYLMEKAIKNENPYKEYSLKEILKHGGICTDRSYFSTNIARGLGIPALTLTGVTNSGPHAWVAIKTTDDTWNTQIGRIGGVSKGLAKDPQTQQHITEQDFWIWSHKDYQNRKLQAHVTYHLWLSEFFQSKHFPISIAKQLTTNAHQLGKNFPYTWKAVYELTAQDPALKKNPENSETLLVWSKLVTGIRQTFKSNPRHAQLAEQIEEKHLFPYLDIEDIRLSLVRERRRNSKKNAEQADLITASLKRESNILLKKDPENAIHEIVQLYARSLRKFEGNNNAFLTAVKDYHSLVKNDKEALSKALNHMEKSFSRVVKNSSADWFNLQFQRNIIEQIAIYHLQVGNEKRAKTLRKRFKRFLEKAERRAL